jgi:hypothetical protein
MKYMTNESHEFKGNIYVCRCVNNKYQETVVEDHVTALPDLTSDQIIALTDNNIISKVK